MAWSRNHRRIPSKRFSIPFAITTSKVARGTGNLALALVKLAILAILVLVGVIVAIRSKVLFRFGEQLIESVTPLRPPLGPPSLISAT